MKISLKTYIFQEICLFISAVKFSMIKFNRQKLYRERPNGFWRKYVIIIIFRSNSNKIILL